MKKSLKQILYGSEGIRLVYLMLLLSVASCNSGRENDNLLVVKQYHSNGLVKDIIETIDSIPNGLWSRYYLDGALESESIYENGLLNGISKSYYENGNPSSVLFYKDDTLSGECKYYFSNGNPKTFCNFFKGKKKGKYYEYYENDSGKIQYEVDYFFIRGTSYVNNYIEYDMDGNINKRSPFIEINQQANDDLEIRLINPEFSKMRIIIGDFDEHFYLNSGNAVDTIESKSFVSQIDLERFDAPIIRGFVENYQWINNDPNTHKTISKDLYFEYNRDL